MMPYIMAAFYIALLGGVYALFFVLNQKTPVPENCKDLLVGCSSCSVGACSHSPVQKVKVI